jgi:hypothetical protein
LFLFASDADHGHCHTHRESRDTDYNVCTCASLQQHRAIAVRYGGETARLYLPQKNADTCKEKQTAYAQGEKHTSFAPLSVLPRSSPDLQHPAPRSAGHVQCLPSLFVTEAGKQPLYLLKDRKPKILPPKSEFLQKKIEPPDPGRLMCEIPCGSKKTSLSWQQLFYKV